MSDAYRRLACRIGFAMLCLLPTIVIVHWVIFPRSAADWRSHARWSIGWPVEIKAVETPTPQRLVFRDVRLHDVQTQSWLSLGDVDCWKAGDGPKIKLAQIDLSLSQLTSFLEHWCEHLPRLTEESRLIELQIAQLVIRSDLDNVPADKAFVIDNCLVRIEFSATQPRMAVEFLSDHSGENPVRWEMICGNDEQPTRWSLNTNRNALPCWLIARFLPLATRFGNASNFSGYVAGENTNQSSRVDISNLQIMDFEPAMLVDDDVPSESDSIEPSIRLADGARCVLLVKTGRILNQRVDSLDLVLHCAEGGKIAGRWLNAARKWLKIDVSEQNPLGWVDVRQWICGLEIRDGKLSVYGQSPDGLIARTSDQQPLIYATANSQGLAPICLAAWIADQGQLQMPVTTASLEVLSHLPVLR